MTSRRRLHNCWLQTQRATDALLRRRRHGNWTCQIFAAISRDCSRALAQERLCVCESAVCPSLPLVARSFARARALPMLLKSAQQVSTLDFGHAARARRPCVGQKLVMQQRAHSAAPERLTFLASVVVVVRNVARGLSTAAASKMTATTKMMLTAAAAAAAALPRAKRIAARVHSSEPRIQFERL